MLVQTHEIATRPESTTYRLGWVNRLAVRLDLQALLVQHRVSLGPLELEDLLVHRLEWVHHGVVQHGEAYERDRVNEETCSWWLRL